MRMDRGHRVEMKYMRCLDVRLCNMHGEGDRYEVTMRRPLLRVA